MVSYPENPNPMRDNEEVLQLVPGGGNRRKQPKVKVKTIDPLYQLFVPGDPKQTGKNIYMYVCNHIAMHICMYLEKHIAKEELIYYSSVNASEFVTMEKYVHKCTCTLIFQTNRTLICDMLWLI